LRLLDRYLFLLLQGPFGFFTLILVGVVWLSQSLRIIDTVINNGQGVQVFVEFTALLLPMVFTMVLPVAALGATVFAVNRLMADSEITVMYSAGSSRLSLAKAVLIFGMTAAVFTAIASLYLSPTASREMRSRISALRADIAAGLIQEGQFMHPKKGLTIYIRETNGDGEMLGVLVHDQRDKEKTVTYHAKRGVLVKASDTPRIVLFDGIGQILNKKDQSLSLLKFDKTDYDLSPYMKGDEGRLHKPSEQYFYQLLNPDAETLKTESAKARGKRISEAHEQLSAPLFALAMPMIAFAIILSGGFSRNQSGRRVFFAVGVGFLVRLLGIATKSMTTSEPFLWPTMYLPGIIALLIAYIILRREGIVKISIFDRLSRLLPANSSQKRMAR